ncbi:NAD(P)/FAD-dependent oxidoreductase [Henriciella aquimarina]|uniref:NAD(P)/FAD-dependent oxidoreductase n=1 Tax=Henriciella aquimarina TaxID=545261 RepID=UPI000A00D8DA|nr:FAD-dependent oxidoreductase [Henriciella aquimarina]
MKKIAIIGSGISGLGAAYALKDTADVTVFEARNRPGGHAHTVSVDHDGTPIDVDVGFIVYNGLNYPNLTGFFDALGVETQPSDMSFAVSNPEGFEWASTAKGMFAWKRNLFRPRFHRFWRTILRFNDIARAEFAEGQVMQESLGYWLKRHGFSEDFRDNYILPMGGAIWSTPPGEILDYPALSFFQFFENHRLMHKGRPKWRTVTGGSRRYVDKAVSALEGRVKLGQPVTRVSRFGHRAKVTFAHTADQVFDEVILATHADTSLRVLDESFGEERFLLKSVRYRPNRAYLHKDPGYMPRRKAAWASWNVMENKASGDAICLTYWMNRLQSLPDNRPLFVTLNPAEPPAPDQVFEEFVFDHPQYDAAAAAAVRALERRQGRDGLWFAGAWLGCGFHEDGLKSGLRPALSLGGHVPWDPVGVETVVPEPRESQVGGAARMTVAP